MIFTIAIPTFNNAKTIHLAIESAINQNFEETFEILVLNNNCTDSTSEILKKYKSKIRIETNDTTVSMWKNHNICLQQAKGDYVLFCHSDDQLLPEALKKIHYVLKNRNFPERYVLWGRSMFRDFYPNWKKGGFNLNEIAAGIHTLNAFMWGGLTPSGTCYSRKAFLETKGFVEANHKLAPSDSVTMWKLVVNYFEFEMTDRLFFVRQYASTACGKNYNRQTIIESMSDAIQCLKRSIPSEGFESIMDFYSNTPDISPFFVNVLMVNSLVNKDLIKRKFLKLIIKDPFIITKKEVRKIVFSLNNTHF